MPVGKYEILCVNSSPMSSDLGMTIYDSQSKRPMWKRHPHRLLLLLCVSVLVSAGCAHSRAGRVQQKKRALFVAGSVVVIVGLALVIGAASKCEDTGACASPNGGEMP